MRPVALFLAGVVALAGVPAAAQKFPDGKVFATPPSTMMSEGKAKFAQGAVMFQRAWKFLEAPVDWNAVFAAGEQGIPGLGPLYNQLSCVGCHARNGRGAAPGEGEAIGSMVVRFSVKGHDEHGGPKPHPAYGSQLNPNGGPDVPGEGDALLRYQSHIETLADGEKVELRAPRLEYRGLNYGPIGPDTMTSIRNAPAVAGLGLLAQAPEEALRAIARQSGGRLNMVWDRETQKTVIGRFGWKANQPSILQQVANAFSEDMGVSSRLFPLENCTGAQTACLIRSTQEMSTELPDEQMEAIAFYLSNLAPPPRRNADAPANSGRTGGFRSYRLQPVPSRKLAAGRRRGDRALHRSRPARHGGGPWRWPGRFQGRSSGLAHIAIMGAWRLGRR